MDTSKSSSNTKRKPRMYQTVRGFNEFLAQRLGLSVQFKGRRVTKQHVTQFFLDHNVPNGVAEYDAFWKDMCAMGSTPEAPVAVEPIPEDNVVEVVEKMTPPFPEMTVQQLKDMCKEHGIKFLSKDTKKVLLEKLSSFDVAAPPIVSPQEPVNEELVSADILARSMVELGDTRHLVDCYIVDKASGHVTGKVDMNDPNLVERELTKEDIDHVISLDLCPVPSM